VEVGEAGGIAVGSGRGVAVGFSPGADEIGRHPAVMTAASNVFMKIRRANFADFIL